MSDEQSGLDDRSLLGSLRWLLVDQFDDTPSDRLRNAFVVIGLATSFLAFVGATTAALSPDTVWWAAPTLAAMGVGMLVFVILIALGNFDQLFGEDYAPAEDDE